jgi:hypothetical protein
MHGRISKTSARSSERADVSAHALLLVPVYLGAVALVVGGIFKLIRPQSTFIALRLAGLPNGPGSVLALAVVEVGLGLVVILRPTPVALAAMSVLYLAFSAFLFRARQVGVGCGCLGESDRPPGMLHVGLDAIVALAALAAVFVR